MSQIINLFSTRNSLTLNFILNFWQMALNVLLVFKKMSMTLLKFRFCFNEQNSCLFYQCVARDTLHLIQQHDLMRRSRIALHDVREHPFLAAFPLWTLLGLVLLQLEFHRESSLLILLCCPFDAGKFKNVSPLLPQVSMLLCQQIPMKSSAQLLPLTLKVPLTMHRVTSAATTIAKRRCPEHGCKNLVTFCRLCNRFSRLTM